MNDARILERRAAWREARIANYADSRSLDALARMVVELEDKYGCVPEFEIDDEWPDRVRHMDVKFYRGGES